MTRGIYFIHNTEEDMLYVGSSNNIEDRIYVHGRMLIRNDHHNSKLQQAYNSKHRLVTYFEPIDDKVCIREFEKRIINELWATGFLYNANRNTNAAMEGLKHSQETRVKMSETHKLRFSQMTAEERSKTIETARLAAMNTPRTEEYKDRQRKIALERFQDPDERKKAASFGFKGKTHSQAAIDKVKRSKQKAVIVDNIEYASVTEAAAANGVCQSLATYRFNSSGFPTWHKK